MPINIDGSKGIRQNTTEVTKIPVGTTAQRPANPEAGMIRFNTDTGQVEGYNDPTDEWRPIDQLLKPVVATGGTVTDIEQGGQLFRVHTFTSDGTFDVARGGEVDVFLVGGGGGGSGNNRGAGGGGFTTTALNVSVGVENVAVTVGAGGIGPVTTGSEAGTSGSASSAVFASQTVTANGGQGGHRNTNGLRPGGDGGSGGAGGTGGTNTSPPGGSDGSDGQRGTHPDSRGGNGQGTTTREFGNPNLTLYAGGGGTGDPTNSRSFAGQGGAGGGGDGGFGGPSTDKGSTAAGRPGIDGLGGGGGSGANDSSGGDGGSGIVIVRYRIG